MKCMFSTVYRVTQKDFYARPYTSMWAPVVARQISKRYSSSCHVFIIDTDTLYHTVRRRNCPATNLPGRHPLPRQATISPKTPDERSGNNLTTNTTTKHPTLTATEQQAGTNRHK